MKGNILFIHENLGNFMKTSESYRENIIVGKCFYPQIYT